MDVLRSHFRPEFLNRIDEVIVFHALGQRADPRHRRAAARARGAAAAARTSSWSSTRRWSITSPKIGYDPEFGARKLKRRIRSELETQLARAMLKDEVRRATA